MKLFKKIFIAIFLYTLCLSLYTPRVGAFTMSNNNWVLDMGNLNSGAGKPTNSNYKVNNTTGQTVPGLYSGSNYKVRSGFQYISSIIPFAFRIDNIVIDFGVLSPTNPVTRTNTLTVSNGSADGYLVTAVENHQLRVPASGALIPDTTCDSGSCTQSTAAAWDNTLTYGFGYRCDNVTGNDCASGFSTSTFYKQFADSENSQAAVSVMSGTNVGRNKAVAITYKLNVAASQPAGLYTNTITYVATPTF